MTNLKTYFPWQCIMLFVTAYMTAIFKQTLQSDCLNGRLNNKYTLVLNASGVKTTFKSAQ